MSLIKAQLDDVVREKYVSKTRNFPGGITLARYIHETIERHPGITTKELLNKLKLPKSTVYDHVKYLIEEERTIKK